jgi:hypothetical protein
MADRLSTERRTGLAVYASLVALSAYGGVVGLATGALDLGPTLNRRLPFHSPVFGALALLVIVAVPAAALAWDAARGDERVGVTASFAGIMLIAWIAVEVAFVREFSWLQPSYVAVGITFVVIGRPARKIARKRAGPRSTSPSGTAILTNGARRPNRCQKARCQPLHIRRGERHSDTVAFNVRPA